MAFAMATQMPVAPIFNIPGKVEKLPRAFLFFVWFMTSLTNHE
jgi:hypothetical protein